MNMNSLRSLTSAFLCSLLPCLSAACAFAEGEPSISSDCGNTKESRLSAEDGKKTKTSKKKKHSDKNSDETDEQSGEKQASGSEKQSEKQKEAPELTEQEAQALAQIQERARQLKAAVTPFNTSLPEESAGEQEGGTLRSSLARRLISARVYLPSKLIIGKTSEFVVKGRAGSHVAIAMADKNSGAKPILGHSLRLGPDRKLVAAGTIPELGVLSLTVDMPIQGDLIGMPVYFETVVWQKEDFSDMQIALPVRSETVPEIADKTNAVLVAGDAGQKRGLRFVPDSAVPLHQRSTVGLESGRP